MKLLVLSDSHGTMEYMLRAVKKERPDVLLHLGDHVSDAEYLRWKNPELPLYCVRGNCDPGTDTPDRRLLVLEGKRLFLCHGHMLGVKNGLLRAVYAAKEEGAELLLFGHTHIPYTGSAEGVLLFNPGSCGSFGSPTYGVITLSAGQTITEIKNAEE